MSVLDALAELLVDVVVVADLLDHLSGLEPQPGGRVGPLLRVVRGRAHGLPPDHVSVECLSATRVREALAVVHTGGADRASTRPSETAETVTFPAVSPQLRHAVHA